MHNKAKNSCISTIVDFTSETLVNVYEHPFSEEKKKSSCVVICEASSSFSLAADKSNRMMGSLMLLFY